MYGICVNENQSEAEVLKMELLQLTILVLYQVPEIASEYQKALIKYAWAHLSVDDMTVKQSAYVLLCRFITEYDTPSKIIAQTYVLKFAQW